MNKELPKDLTILNEEEVTQHCSASCPRCQGVLQTIEIHGHTQCVICHAVVEECCQGQQR